MDFSSTELFIEILVVGVLFSFAISPILICLFPYTKEHDGWLPYQRDLEKWKPTLVLVIALVYTTGIAGNRYSQSLFGSISRNFDKPPDADPKEFAVSSNEAGRTFVERHKSYLKIMRAASCASFLFAGCMILYGTLRPLLDQKPRYNEKHFAIAILVGALFLGSFSLERKHYSDALGQYWDYLTNAPPELAKKLPQTESPPKSRSP